MLLRFYDIPYCIMLHRYYYNIYAQAATAPQKAHFAVWAYFYALRGAVYPRILTPKIKVTLLDFELPLKFPECYFAPNQLKYRL